MSPQESRTIPERLKRNNRPAVQEFDPQERLFHRYNELIEEGGCFYPASIRFPDFSVNRELFSEPEDVLLPIYQDYGVAAFKVEDIPGEQVVEQGTSKETVYNFTVVHVPESENYAHSEVRVEKDGVYKNNLRVKNKEVKRNFRFKLSERLIMLRQPSTVLSDT